MQFTFAIGKMVQLDSEGFGKIDKAILGNNSDYNVVGSTHSVTNNSSKDLMLKTVIDTMGELSTKAQGLKAVITSYSRIMKDQNIYIKAEGNQVYGFLKVGIKTLFYRDYAGNIKEIKPLCVLDFYVHESVQRNGYGKMIFNYMLEKEKISPQKIAYDRPSKLLISFLRKHFNLVNYIPQNNNFVIFNQYFETTQNKSDQISQALQQQTIAPKPKENIDQQQIQQDFERQQQKLAIQEAKNSSAQPGNLNFFNGESTDYYQKYNKAFSNQVKQEIPSTQSELKNKNFKDLDNQVQNIKSTKQGVPQNINDKISKTEEELQKVTERIKEMQLQQNYAEEFKNLQMKTNGPAPWATNKITIPMQTQSQQYGNFYSDKGKKSYF